MGDMQEMLNEISGLKEEEDSSRAGSAKISQASKRPSYAELKL